MKLFPPLFDRIYIEISNICNLKCSFCPEVTKDKKIMSPLFFEKVLEQVALYTKEIALHVLGEPLAHPSFQEIIAIAQRKKVPINLTTNGIFIEKYEKELLTPIIRQINFSLQSFQDNFPSGDYKKYLNKIFYFAQKAEKERPELYLNYRLWDLSSSVQNKDQEIYFKEIVAHYQNIELNPNVNVEMIKSKRLRSRHYLHFDSRFVWPSLSHPIIGTTGFCYGGQKQLAIHADGILVPCCLDKEAAINLGNISQQKFQDILTEERLSQLVQFFLEGQVKEDLCQRCQYRTRFDRKAKKIRGGKI